MAKRFLKYDTKNPVGVDKDGVLIGSENEKLVFEYTLISSNGNTNASINLADPQYAEYREKLDFVLEPNSKFRVEISYTAYGSTYVANLYSEFAVRKYNELVGIAINDPHYNNLDKFDYNNQGTLSAHWGYSNSAIIKVYKRY